MAANGSWWAPDISIHLRDKGGHFERNTSPHYYIMTPGSGRLNYVQSQSLLFVSTHVAEVGRIFAGELIQSQFVIILKQKNVRRP